MVTLRRTGLYKLIETKRHTKVLHLDNDTYAWVEPVHIGVILVISHKVHKTDCVLSVGKYCIYDVVDEPKLTDIAHLELEVGEGIWQGYLLLTGMPDDHKKRARIVPTDQVITDNPEFMNRVDIRANLAAS